MLKNYALLVFMAGFFCFLPLTVMTVAAGIPMDTAQLRALDKITGRTSTVEVKVGEVAEFGTLLIKVDVCKTNPPEETPENAGGVPDARRERCDNIHRESGKSVQPGSFLFQENIKIRKDQENGGSDRLV